MRFGTCPECSEYKYLPDENQCSYCNTSEKNWVVLQAACVRRGSRVILEDNLTREEAIRIAENSQYKVATTHGR